MGLTDKNEVTDKSLEWGNWERKVELERTIKQTNTGLNYLGPLWRSSIVSPTNGEICCNAQVHIAKASAVVTLGSSDGTEDEILPERLYLCKEETSTWIKEYLSYTTNTHSNRADLQATMANSNYSITKYGEYVPEVVKSAVEKYKTKYFELHTRNNPKLTKEMIDISFVSFQCYMILGEQPAIDHHMDKVHGIEDGIISLTEKIEIDVAYK